MNSDLEFHENGIIIITRRSRSFIPFKMCYVYREHVQGGFIRSKNGPWSCRSAARVDAACETKGARLWTKRWKFSEWYRWFAWRPVKTMDGIWMWLHQVERIRYPIYEWETNLANEPAETTQFRKLIP